ncbi:right-handed parallel beta-helix repeat-containing protein [Halorussus halophilus]|uniref:right-handed parallel beta-helix repeat-containing protein n=1 Tax=Halorussus halophilus TaxID=2650975 RepID=UPI001300DF01|nr:right-handed parallel beta-helix repeat-containing protein [Halorussus halophilus]
MRVLYVFVTVGLLLASTTGANSVVEQNTDASPQQIDSCTTITESGRYVLTGDIVNSTAETCIRIEASDVVFDGGGHVVDGNWSVLRNRTVGDENITEEYLNDSEIPATTPNPTTNRWAYHGVFVTGSSNVTVTAVTTTDWVYGVAVAGTSDGLVTGVTTEQTVTGVGLYRTTGIRATENQLTNNSVGIVLDGLDGGSATVNSIVESKLDGIALLDSTGVTVSNNTVNRTQRYDGIYLRNSSRNVITRNTVSNSVLSGITVADNSNGNTVAENLASENGLNGILLMQDSSQNTIRGNDAMANEHSGIALVSDANENNVIDNTVVNTSGTATYTVELNYSAGIVVNGSDDNRFIGNYLWGNVHSGITLTSQATDNEFVNDVILNTTTLRAFEFEGNYTSAIAVRGSGDNSFRNTMVRDTNGWSYFSFDNPSPNTVQNLTISHLKRLNVSSSPEQNFTLVDVAADVSFVGRDVAVDINTTRSKIEPDWSPRRIGPRVTYVQTSPDARITNLSVQWRILNVSTTVQTTPHTEQTSDSTDRGSTTNEIPVVWLNVREAGSPIGEEPRTSTRFPHPPRRPTGAQ